MVNASVEEGLSIDDLKPIFRLNIVSVPRYTPNLTVARALKSILESCGYTLEDGFADNNKTNVKDGYRYELEKKELGIEAYVNVGVPRIEDGIVIFARGDYGIPPQDITRIFEALDKARFSYR